MPELEGDLRECVETLWYGYKRLGFDTDGEEHPDAYIGYEGIHAFCERMKSRFDEMRKDYDDVVSESEELRGALEVK